VHTTASRPPCAAIATALFRPAPLTHPIHPSRPATRAPFTSSATPTSAPHYPSRPQAAAPFVATRRRSSPHRPSITPPASGFTSSATRHPSSPVSRRLSPPSHHPSTGLALHAVGHPSTLCWPLASLTFVRQPHLRPRPECRARQAAERACPRFRARFRGQPAGTPARPPLRLAHRSPSSASPPWNWFAATCDCLASLGSPSPPPAVEFEDRRDAEDAVRALDGRNGWRVEFARSSGPREKGGYGGGGGGGGGGGYGGASFSVSALLVCSPSRCNWLLIIAARVRVSLAALLAGVRAPWWLHAMAPNASSPSAAVRAVQDRAPYGGGYDRERSRRSPSPPPRRRSPSYERPRRSRSGSRERRRRDSRSPPPRRASPPPRRASPPPRGRSRSPPPRRRDSRSPPPRRRGDSRSPPPPRRRDSRSPPPRGRSEESPRRRTESPPPSGRSRSRSPMDD
jgi:hypothetical protein